MPRIFLDSSSIDAGRVRVSGADARHLVRSLRARVGELLVVVEAGVTEHGVVLDHIGRADVSGVIAWSRPATGEPRLQSHVLQAVPQRGMDEAVEGLSVIGATHIHPLLTARTVTQPGAAGAERRLERWRAIARESAQLAGRARVPVIHPLGTIAEACAALPDGVCMLVAHLDGERPLRAMALEAERPLALWTGPEGGFDAQELAALRTAGAASVHLGPRVLPARLAGAIALAIALAAAGELDAPPVRPPKI